MAESNANLLSYFESYDVGDNINRDHSYSNVNWTGEKKVLPTIYLFKMNDSKLINMQSFNIDIDDNEGSINVTDLDENSSEAFEKPPLYDVTKSINTMNECQRYAHFARVFNDEDGNIEDEDADNEDDDKIDNDNNKNSANEKERKPCKLKKEEWTKAHKFVNKRVLKILKSERLKRLTHENTENEFIKRKLSTSTSADQFRRVMAAVNWNKSVTSWLHNRLTTHLPDELFIIYMEILQILQPKLPCLVDEMIGEHLKRLNKTAADGVNVLLSCPWQPVDVVEATKRNINLAVQPVFLNIENILDSSENATSRKRSKLWESYLSDIGRVYNISHNDDDAHLDGMAHAGGDRFKNHMGKLGCKILDKIRKIKYETPRTQIFLIGKCYTSLIACLISNKEKVDGVVCLNYSFPKSGTNQSLNISAPTLYVIGQNSKLNCPIEKLETYRQQYDVLTGLVVVDGADDDLNIDSVHSSYYEITQTIVDKCILEKMKDFVVCVLNLNRNSGRV